MECDGGVRCRSDLVVVVVVQDTSDIATFDSQWENDGDGYINLKFNTNTSISGLTARTTVQTLCLALRQIHLTIRSDSVGIQTLGVTISQSDATNSPLTSDTVNFAAVSNADQFNVNVEAIGIANTATLSSINLFNGDYTFYTTGSDAAQPSLQTSTAFIHQIKISLLRWIFMVVKVMM